MSFALKPRFVRPHPCLEKLLDFVQEQHGLRHSGDRLVGDCCQGVDVDSCTRNMLPGLVLELMSCVCLIVEVVLVGYRHALRQLTEVIDDRVPESRDLALGELLATLHDSHYFSKQLLALAKQCEVIDLPVSQRDCHALFLATMLSFMTILYRAIQLSGSIFELNLKDS
jgi:hypothetical protein